MKLATLKNGSPDGRLVVVSRDLSKAAFVDGIAASMLEAVENWDQVSSSLETVYNDLNAGAIDDGFDFDPAKCAAPIPRCYQFIDASAFLNHGNIIEEAYNLTVEKTPGIPIMLQRQSDDFRGSLEDYPFISEEDGADFEGEFAVVVDEVPMGASTEVAQQKIRLIGILNDVSMRTHLFRELKMGFGFINAKPATVFAPVMVTPDELGDAWRDGKIHLDMNVKLNGEWFGNPNGGEMDFTWGQIIAHLVYNRCVKAGTIIGSGTVSNKNWKEVGSACLAERRALDMLEYGEVRTEFLKFGDQLEFEVRARDGHSLCGAINHKMVKA